MKKPFWSLYLLVLLTMSACQMEKEDTGSDSPSQLLLRLNALPDLQAQAIPPPTGFLEAFRITVNQPLDHDNPAGERFPQTFYLSHRHSSAPTVFYTSGYGIRRNYESEMAALLEGNQILLVHRFFPDARPSSVDWSKLTIRQAATDQHRIRELLGQIYTGPWVSSGASKGGMTALFYKRFYPDDVDATVAYVAPIMDRTDDPRFVPYLNQLGDQEIRRKIITFQREILTRRGVMLDLLRSHAADQSYSFSRIGQEAALEYSVLEYRFAFWQYGPGDINDIPDAQGSDSSLFDHLVQISPFSFYDDRGIEYYEPLFYQAHTEIGYCPYITEDLEDLLIALDHPDYRSFAPLVNMPFNPSAMAEQIPWLRTMGNHIVYIYGAQDPWSAAALHPADGVDALFVMQQGENHRVTISVLDRRQQVIDCLNRWLGTEIQSSTANWNIQDELALRYQAAKKFR